MIRKLLSCFFILSFVFFGVSFAYMDTVIDLPGNFSIGDFSNSINNNLNFGGGVLKIVNGTPGAGNETYTYYLWNHGKLYVYSPSDIRGNIQGFVKSMCKISGDGICSSSYSVDVLNEFYSSSIPFQKLKINITNVAGICAYNGEYTFCFNPLVGNDWAGNLSGSLGIPSDNYVDRYSQLSPFTFGNMSGGSSISDNVYLTGNLSYDNSCTNGYVINKINDIMGDSYIYVCYAGTYNTGLIDNDFQSETYIYNYGLTLRELYQLTSDGMSYLDRFYTYSDEIKRYKNGSVGVNPFLSRPIALYTYFDNLYNQGFLFWGNNVDLLGPTAYNNYCNLVLYSDYNSFYSGSYYSSICRYKSVDSPDISVDDSGSGNVVSVSWDGVLSGDVNKNYDGKNFINDFYQKLTANFQKPTGSGNGIIPSYIIVFLVAIILFRFLRK